MYIDTYTPLRGYGEGMALYPRRMDTHWQVRVSYSKKIRERMWKGNFRIRSRYGIEHLLDNVFLNKYLLEHLYTSLYVVVCMCCHECETHQCVLWSTRRWYHGIDENSIIESQPSDHECFVNVANV